MLLDHSARNRFETEIDRNFCVSAGAGTGKTTALVNRIYHLATQNLTHAVSQKEDPLTRLIVVTYGKLAAEELRIRTQNLLMERLIASPYLHSILARLKKAFFGTIHSFCLKLLRDEGYHLGLPTHLDLLEDTQEIWGNFCESENLKRLTFPQPQLKQFLRHFTFETLLQIAQKLSTDEAENLLLKKPPAIFSPPNFDLLNQITLKGRGAESSEKNLKHLLRWKQEFETSSDYLEIPFYETGSKEFKQSVAETFQAYLNALSHIGLYLAAHITLAYRDFRVSQNKMTYDDQIQWCRQLLHHPEIVERLRARGYIILLDEAQDTDSAMFSILVELTRPPNSVPLQWPTDPAAPGPLKGRFSFVGDNQQTIYSHRASLATYQRYMEAYQKDSENECLEFSVTMRCPKQVVHTINQIFPGRLTQIHVEFRKLNPKPQANEGLSCNLVVPLPLEATSDTKQFFQQECHTVAQWLKNNWTELNQIASPPLTWDDVAVLCPRIDWLEQAKDIFEKYHLPVTTLSTKQPSFLKPALSWPVMLLYSLLNPYDRFELLGVLREIFVISDITLAKAHRQLPEGLNLLSQLPQLPELHSVLSLLQELRNMCLAEDLSLSLTQRVQKVFNKIHLRERLMAIQEPVELYDYFLSQIREAECQKKSLRFFIKDWVKQLKSPSPSLIQNQPAIQLITSYKAKGLEWPVVIPLGLGRKIAEAPEPFPQIQRHFENQTPILYLHPYSQNTEYERTKKIRAQEELQRLFYVTLTRAKSILCIPETSQLYLRQSDSTFAALAQWETLPLNTFSKTYEFTLEKELSYQSKNQTLTLEKSRQNDLTLSHFPKTTHAELFENIYSFSEPLHPFSRLGVDYDRWWKHFMKYFPWKQGEQEKKAYTTNQIELLEKAAPSLTQRATKEINLFQQHELYQIFKNQGSVFLRETYFNSFQSPEKEIMPTPSLTIQLKDESYILLGWKTDLPDANENSLQFHNRLLEAYQKQLSTFVNFFQNGMKQSLHSSILYATATGTALQLKSFSS